MSLLTTDHLEFINSIIERVGIDNITHYQITNSPCSGRTLLIFTEEEPIPKERVKDLTDSFIINKFRGLEVGGNFFTITINF